MEDLNNNNNKHFLMDKTEELGLYRTLEIVGTYKIKLHGNYPLVCANDNFFKIIGYTREEFVSQLDNQCAFYIYPEDLINVKNIVRKALTNNEKSIEWIVRISTAKNEMRYMRSTGKVEKFEDDSYILSGVNIEVTNQLQIKQVNNRRIARLEFLSRLSHEIRTPLNSIIGMNQLAKEDCDNHKALQNDLSQIDKYSSYLLNLIEDISDVGRIESGNITIHKKWCTVPSVLDSIINAMVPMMKKKKLHFTYPTITKENFQHIEWYVDPKRTQQIIVKLLNNAYKFTPECGYIDFKIENILIDKDSNNAVDLITVKDTGCGMSREFVKDIGREFIQENNRSLDKVSGTGIGLYLVKNLIEEMGGELKVLSVLGKGSEFTLTFPYKFRTIEKIEQLQLPKKQYDISGMKILLVEDNKINKIIAKRILENEKAIVVTVENGLEAVNIFKKSAVYEFNAILMDIRMPVMNGIDATIQIRNSNREDSKTIPIIALTADIFSEDINKGISAGMNEYLNKPIKTEKVYKSLSKYKKHNI